MGRSILELSNYDVFKSGPRTADFVDNSKDCITSKAQTLSLAQSYLRQGAACNRHMEKRFFSIWYFFALNVTTATSDVADGTAVFCPL